MDVERSGELGLGQFVRGVPIKEVVRRTGLARNTIRTALRSDRLRFGPGRPPKLDSLKDEIHRLLKDDPKLPGVRVREESHATRIPCWSDALSPTRSPLSRYGAAGGPETASPAHDMIDAFVKSATVAAPIREFRLRTADSCAAAWLVRTDRTAACE